MSITRSPELQIDRTVTDSRIIHGNNRIDSVLVDAYASAGRDPLPFAFSTRKFVPVKLYSVWAIVLPLSFFNHAIEFGLELADLFRRKH